MSGLAIDLNAGLLLSLLLSMAAGASELPLAVVHVEGAGGCSLAVADLPSTPERVAVEQVRVTRGDEVLASTVLDDGDGVLGRGDEIRFLMPPVSSLHATHAAVRVGIAPGDEPVGDRPGDRMELDHWAFDAGIVFDALPTDDAALIEEGASRHWFLARVPPRRTQSLSLELPPGGTGSEDVTLVPVEIVVRGRRSADARFEARIEVEGAEPVQVEGSGARPVEVEIEAPASSLAEGALRLAIENTGQQELLLESVVVRAPFLLELGRTTARVVRIDPPPAPLPGGGDLLMLCPAALTPALEPLVAHRRRQGYTPAVVTLEQVFCRHSGGDFDPNAIERFVREALVTWDPAPRLLLLAGDADRDSDRFRPFESLPARIVEVQGDGGAASDAPHGALDDRGVPQLAVGRLPARDAADLEMLVARIIAYEDDPPPGTWRRRVSLVFGEGRFGAAADRSIETMATALVGRAIPPELDVEVTFASPGSPFLVPPDRLSDEVIASMNRGALVFAYVGHGARRRLDDLRMAGRTYPILDAARIADLGCAAGPPLVFFIACSTGEFDHPGERCLAEEALLQPDGPIAVIAASRVSYPYANAILAKETIDTFLKGQEAGLGAGIAAVHRHMLESSDPMRALIDMAAISLLPDPRDMERQRRDQILLYNLLGDPALMLARPRGRVEIEAPETATRGQRLLVRGQVDGLDGESEIALVTLEVERTRMLDGLVRLDGLQGEARDRAIAGNHRRANDKVLVRVEARVENGRFEASVAIPASAPDGPALVKVHVSGGGDASGAAPLEIETPAPPSRDDYF